MKKRIALFLTALLLIAALFVLSSCKKDEQTPFEFLAEAIQKTAESQENSMDALLLEALNGGSAELTVNFGTSLGLPLTQVTLKDYFSSDNASSVLKATNREGKTLDLTAWANKDALVMSSNAAASSYGITISDFTQLLEDSLADAPDLGDLGLDASLMQGLPLDEETAQLLSEKLTAAFEKNAVATKITEDGIVNVVIELTGEKTALFLCDFIESVQNEEAVMPFFDYYLSALSSLSEEEMTAQEFFASYDRNEVIAELSASPISIKLEVNATTKKIIQDTTFSLSYAEGSEDELLYTTKTALNGSFSANVSYQGNTVAMKWEVSETDDTYSGTFSLSTSGVTMKPLTLTYNKTTGNYTMDIVIPATLSLTVKGNYATTQDSLTFSVSSIRYSVYGEDSLFGSLMSESIDLSMNFTLKTKDTPPACPENYRNVLLLDEEKLEALRLELLQNEVLADILSLFPAEEE